MSATTSADPRPHGRAAPPASPCGPLRVALVTRSLMTGGAQRHVVKLCQTVDPALVALTVIMLIGDEPTDLVREVPAHVPVIVSPYRRHHPLSVPWLIRECRRLDIHVAHSFLWTADVYTSLAHVFMPAVTLLCSERGDRSLLQTPLRRTIDRWLTFRRASAVCANSEFGRKVLIEHGCQPGKVRVIRNGVDLARLDATPRHDIRSELGWPSEAVVVGIVSRLIDYKRVDTLVRAAARWKSAYPIYCAVLGDGPLRSELEALCRSLDVTHRVAILGARTGALSWVKDFDIATLFTETDTEHCSNSILEYMACGKPVIATLVGGNPELIEDGHTGLLIPRAEQPAADDAIRRLMDDPALGHRMGSAGRQRAERDFDMTGVSQQFVALWHAASIRIQQPAGRTADA